MKKNNRRKRLILNTTTSIVYQIVTIICGFILPKLFLTYYGSEVNGLIASITQFLGFIALMELGIGAVVQSALYKPLALDNNKEISKIIKSAKIFFNKIALIFVVYLFALILFFPKINDSFGWLYSAGLILAIAISSIAQYFFGMAYQLLLSANQKSYVSMTISILTLILNTILSAILISNGFSIHIVKLLAAIILLLRPIMLNIYIKKNYNLIKDIKYKEEPIKQKWNGIAQHIASFVLNNTDIIVLTIFANLVSVSIYSIYNLIVTGIKQVILATTAGIQSLFGNMLANNEYTALNKRFQQLEWVMHTVVTLLFSCTLVLITPFVNVYTKGIIDANYNQPLFGVLLTLATAAYCLRLPYNIIVLAAGHYKETQLSAIIEMSINILMSVMLVSKYGLVGVAIGTLVAMLYRTIYLANYISGIIEYKFGGFIKHMVVNIIILILTLMISSNFNMLGSDYLHWFIFAIKIFTIAAGVTMGINLVFYRKVMIDSTALLKARRNKK